MFTSASPLARRYQRELSLAVEREQSLERDKVQLGLDWQRRCEGLERDHYQQHEGLVQGLASARAQVRGGVSEEAWALSCGNTGPHGAVGLNIESCDQCVPALPTSLAPCFISCFSH